MDRLHRGTIVCLDLGTARVGVAISFPPEQQQDAAAEDHDTHAAALILRHWPHERGNTKTRANVLLTPAGRFVALGQTATNLFLEQARDRAEFDFIDDAAEHLPSPSLRHTPTAATTTTTAKTTTAAAVTENNRPTKDLDLPAAPSTAAADRPRPTPAKAHAEQLPSSSPSPQEAAGAGAGANGGPLLFFRSFKMALAGQTLHQAPTLYAEGTTQTLPCTLILQRVLEHLREVALMRICGTAPTSVADPNAIATTPVSNSSTGKATAAAPRGKHATQGGGSPPATGPKQTTSTNHKIKGIIWVIPVPSTWSAAAIQLVQQAAVNADLVPSVNDPHLVIAQEAEVAALACKAQAETLLPTTDTLPMTRTDKERPLQPIKAGDAYVVVDAGGGTCDVTMHEILPDGRVLELVARSGAEYGSTHIDRAFLALLRQVFGDPLMDHYEQHYAIELEEALLNWEAVKVSFEPNSTEHRVRRLRLPLFKQAAADIGADPFHTTVRGVEFTQRSRLCLTHERVMALVDTAVVPVVEHVLREIGALPRKTRGILKVCYLVGGFADCESLYTKLNEALRNLRDCGMLLYRPPEPSHAVLLGGLIFGRARCSQALSSSSTSASGAMRGPIASRICPQTFGIDSYGPWSMLKHPRSRRIVLKDGRTRAEKLFAIHMVKGSSVPDGSVFARSYGPLYSGQKFIDLKVYASTKKKPVFVDDPSCWLLGVLTIGKRHDDAHGGKEQKGEYDEDGDPDVGLDSTASATSNEKGSRRPAGGAAGSDRDVSVTFSWTAAGLRVRAVDALGKSVGAKFDALVKL